MTASSFFNKNDLEERTSYELLMLEFLRARLFSQIETLDSGFEIILGNNRTTQYTCVPSLSFSQSAVEQALSYFRPIAVASAFKLQDMIVEWILGANNRNDWRFIQKIESYKKLKKSGLLNEPSYFNTHINVSEAFWNLYEKIEAPRGALIHKGHLKIESDGTFKITDRKNNTTVFTPEIQASYIRFCCIITRILLDMVKDINYYEIFINNDLANLSALGCVGFSHIDFRAKTLRIRIPQNLAISVEPYAIEIDFAPIVGKLREIFPVDPTGKLVISTEVIAEASNRTLKWSLPSDWLPNGSFEFREDDPQLSAFLNH